MRSGREVVRKLRRDGLRGAVATAAGRVHARMSTDAGFAAHVLEGDLADSASLRLESAAPVGRESLTVGWVCAPAAPGSGGHTTLFRMLAAVKERGHTCVVFLYDAWGGAVDHHAARMRKAWPVLDDVEFRDATHGIDGVDACIASSWESAHALASHGRGAMHRFYFVQDFEPFFHPRGPIYAAAEDSYRFGYTHLALGHAVQELLASEVGVVSSVVPFGCDTETYHLQDAQRPRSGVVFFSRPGVPRRGYHLAVAAFAEFHHRRPDVEIHAFGDRAPALPFPVTDHGKLAPARLNDLYNRTVTGLALSFTNVTLVAGEMLAAGCTPVVNRSAYTPGGLDNPLVVTVESTPSSLAQAMVELVDEDPLARADRAVRASRSIDVTWGDAQARFVQLVEDAVRRRGVTPVVGWARAPARG